MHWYNKECTFFANVILMLSHTDELKIRPSVDGLCRDGPSEISRDPHTKRLQTQPKRLGWL